MTLTETTDFTTGDRVFTIRVPHKELAAMQQVMDAEDFRLAITAMRKSTKLSAKLTVLAVIAQVFEQLEDQRRKPGAGPGESWFGGN